MKRLFIIASVLILLLFIGAQQNLIKLPGELGKAIPRKTDDAAKTVISQQRILSEESVVIGVIEKSLPSVVTIGISKTTQTGGVLQIDPRNPFQPFRRLPGQTKQIEQNIGSGFIVAETGLIVTNKHVVADTEATYKVLTNDHKTYEVKKISRDPLNDLAILKIDATGLPPLPLGDSTRLKLGQLVVAIGTPLGEFTNSVTSGIISGLGRGIEAGSPYEEYVERLDNVIQTDAAISPGNSGGPLIGSDGAVIGVNTAVSSSGENIGFAIPISVVQDLLKNFDPAAGVIKRPFLGIRYQMINKQNAITNSVPQGAYIVEVLASSSADKAGIKPEDIITEFDGKKIMGDSSNTLQKLIAGRSVGDSVKVKLYRDGKIIEKTIIFITLE